MAHLDNTDHYRVYDGEDKPLKFKNGDTAFEYAIENDVSKVMCFDASFMDEFDVSVGVALEWLDAQPEVPAILPDFIKRHLPPEAIEEKRTQQLSKGMTKTLYGDNIWKARCDALEARLEALEGKQAPAESEPVVDKPWPQKGDACYLLGGEGDALWDRWQETEAEVRLLARGLVFRTKEEAEKADQLRLAMNELKVMSEKEWDTRTFLPLIVMCWADGKLVFTMQSCPVLYIFEPKT